MSNRLQQEKSPYLQQHSDNPVDWQPWDEAALEEARERDVPIFLSVGYSACHWCHVMEDESFQDTEVAKLLNENYVPVKVDREERPDIDKIYQTTCQLITGRGGWPLSVWLTAEGEPFYVGTYFPKEPKRGHPGFLDILEQLSDDWGDNREEVEKRAEKWTRKVKSNLEETADAGETEDDVLDVAAGQAVDSADRKHGGFGSGQKFPQTTKIEVLMDAYAVDGPEVYRDVAEGALDAMVGGGLHDHVGGGFHRYTTDREWVVPHFEKMLYDNAEITRVLVEGYKLTGNDVYLDTAEKALEFVEDEMTSPGGGFYSTLDAQSDGEEGKFYVWTPGEVRELLDGDVAELFIDRYGITERGNFEGSNVLTINTAIGELAENYGLEEKEVWGKLEDARTELYDAREERVRPGRDEKILAGWNGLMLSAFAEASLVLDEPSLEETAEDAVEFIREELWNSDEELLYRRYKDREVTTPGFLEDYAFLSRGVFDLYQVTGDKEHLEYAAELADVLVDEFYDEDRETLYFTGGSNEDLLSQPQEVTDASTPSSMGVACDILLTLASFREDDRYLDVAGSVLDTHSDKTGVNPLQHASLVLAAERYLNGGFETTVVDDDLRGWSDWIAKTYLPRRTLTLKKPDVDEVEGQVPPIWEGKEIEGDASTLYLCRDFTCSPPLTEETEADEWLEKLS